MFGFETASYSELTKAEKDRYGAVYCGICRQIRLRSSQTARLGLSYDMAFLALLLMSLYEPEESAGKKACALHPVKPRPWVDNEYIRYAADMNVALARYQTLDDWNDDKKLSAGVLTGIFARSLPAIEERFPRQCRAIRGCIEELSRLERENCADPDGPAGCFGQLMGELLVYREDLWAPTLRQMGMALGRFIYLGDAAVDYRRDKRRKKYNPFLLAGGGEDWETWERLLVTDMAKCCDAFEKLPLVQDKSILDNILYSGVWYHFHRMKKKDQEVRQ